MISDIRFCGSRILVNFKKKKIFFELLEKCETIEYFGFVVFLSFNLDKKQTLEKVFFQIILFKLCFYAIECNFENLTHFRYSTVLRTGSQS